jgi:hypothetical protein
VFAAAKVAGDTDLSALLSDALKTDGSKGACAYMIIPSQWGGVHAIISTILDRLTLETSCRFLSGAVGWQGRQQGG